MAVEILKETMNIDGTHIDRDYQGLSSDTKPAPSDLGDNSSFTELDTGNVFEYSLTNINPATSNGWWGI